LEHYAAHDTDLPVVVCPDGSVLKNWVGGAIGEGAAVVPQLHTVLADLPATAR
jgi:hypothetical protein